MVGSWRYDRGMNIQHAPDVNADRDCGVAPGHWACALELNAQREVVAGSADALADAIRRGADLRIGTDFRHNEHIQPGGDNAEIIREVSDFRTTYLIDDRWVAGIMTLRMPVQALEGFGPRASMSFFMYNQDGTQAIARPYLDGQSPTSDGTASADVDAVDMPKMHLLDRHDLGSNAPSENFIYDFDNYRYLVRDGWQEVLSHDAEGRVTKGSFEALMDRFVQGCDIKVGIEGLCADCGEQPSKAMGHELFVHCGPGYYETESKRFAAGSQPTVRVVPAVPMRYGSRGWDVGWLLPRTDGTVYCWLCDPFTLQFHKREGRYSIRWFVQ